MTDIINPADPQPGDDTLPSLPDCISRYVNSCQAQIDAFENSPGDRWKLFDSNPMVFRTGRQLIRRAFLDTGGTITLVSFDQFVTDDHWPNLNDGGPHDYHVHFDNLVTDQAAIAALSE